MEITDIRIKTISSDSKMKAVVSVTFDNAFVVHDIKIIEGQDKLFTAMPSRKTPEGEYKDIAHPINSAMRSELESRILAKYEELPETAEEHVNRNKQRFLLCLFFNISIFHCCFRY